MDMIGYVITIEKSPYGRQKSRPSVVSGYPPVVLDGDGDKTQNLCNTRPRKSIPADVPKGGATASCTPSCSSLPPIPNSRGGRCSSSRPLLPSTTCSLGMSSAALSGICITCKFRPALPIAESGASSSASLWSQSVRNAPNFAIDGSDVCLLVSALNRGLDAKFRGKL